MTSESERKHVKKTISLEDYPALRSVVEAFRASFTGDVTQLKKVYETTVEGTSRKWTCSSAHTTKLGSPWSIICCCQGLWDTLPPSQSERRTVTAR